MIIGGQWRRFTLSDEFYDITGVGTKDVLERIEKLEVSIDNIEKDLHIIDTNQTRIAHIENKLKGYQFTVNRRLDELEPKVDPWIKRMDENMHGLIRDYNETLARYEKLEAHKADVSHVNNNAIEQDRLRGRIEGLETLYLKISEENARLLEWVRRLEKRLDKK